MAAASPEEARHEGGAITEKAALQRALDAAGVGAWIWDIRGERLLWDKITYRLFGVDPSGFAVTPESVRELFDPRDRTRIDQQLADCVAKRCDFQCEFRVIWPSDGSSHHLRARGRVFRNDETGGLRMTGAFWDISDRKGLEEDLARERFLLQTLMENLPDKIYFKDAQSRFVRVSAELLHWFGAKEAKEISGKTDFDFFSEEHARQAFEDEQRIMQTGQTLRAYEEKETWPDGHETWVSTTKLPLRDPEGRVVGTFGLSRDITDRRRAEQQLAKYAEELRRRNQELEEDLEMARELQGALLPRHYPQFSSSGDPRGSALRFSHIFNPSAAVSGDFFDIIKLSETAAGVFICDVMGHGVRAALVAAIVRALVSDLSAYADAPGEFLGRLNRKLFGILSQTEIPMFASASYVIADLGAGELRYANAGHPDPVHIHHGAQGAGRATSRLSGRGPVLGMFDTPQYTASSSVLSVHDAVLQFTDGLYEVEGESGELYDEQSLVRAVTRRASLGAGELCRQVLAEVQQFSASKQFNDDVCLVALEVEELGAA